MRAAAAPSAGAAILRRRSARRAAARTARRPREPAGRPCARSWWWPRPRPAPLPARECRRPVDDAAAIEHRLALGEAEPDAVGGQLPARLMVVEERAFELGPEAAGLAADGRRGDEPGVVTPGRQQAPQVVARHQDIAVRHHDPIVLRGAPALVDVVQLWIVADRLVADEEAGADLRVVAISRSTNGTTGSPGSATQNTIS